MLLPKNKTNWRTRQTVKHLVFRWKGPLVQFSRRNERNMTDFPAIHSTAIDRDVGHAVLTKSHKSSCIKTTEFPRWAQQVPPTDVRWDNRIKTCFKKFSFFYDIRQNNIKTIKRIRYLIRRPVSIVSTGFLFRSLVFVSLRGRRDNVAVVFWRVWRATPAVSRVRATYARLGDLFENFKLLFDSG